MVVATDPASVNADGDNGAVAFTVRMGSEGAMSVRLVA